MPIIFLTLAPINIQLQILSTLAFINITWRKGMIFLTLMSVNIRVDIFYSNVNKYQSWYFLLWRLWILGLILVVNLLTSNTFGLNFYNGHLTCENERSGFWTLLNRWVFGIIYRSNESLYLGQAFNNLDKLVIKPKNTWKKKYFFMLKHKMIFLFFIF